MTEKPRDRIGRYRLLQEIGHGGCGVVYMAEQEEPVRRKVALKVIKLGMDTKQVVARFEAERQALALMDHPNIAKIHDAGVTGIPLTPIGGEGDRRAGEGAAGYPRPSDGRGAGGEGLSAGRPYFVMELVGGIKITDYCDQNNLTTRQRLDLFVQVCRAIQHAHQKGVIHRDIKPSNVLVATQDGGPVPKVIDFGIAKATQGRLTDQTLFTAFEQFLGTPAYMSPEQAQLGSLDVDTRSDIYSLGVLLYELLTGTTPFGTKELVAAGLDEMRRTIREVEPIKPSTRLTQELVAAPRQSAADSTDENGGALPRRRYGQIQELVHSLRGDLDWIVMKCLEKDRSRRYETANGLARDIERHLNNEPVVARPPSKLYEFQKTVRRHKFGFAATAAIIIVLAGGVTFSSLQAVRATRAELEQSRLREQAQQAQANEARERLRAEQAATLEVEQRARAQTLAENNRVNLYAARIKLAEQTLHNGDVARVLDLLESLRPQEGQEDLRSFDWYYLWQLCHSERLVYPESGRVLSTAFSPDGRLLAFAGDSGIIRLCEAETGAPRIQLTGHTGRVGSIAFCPDGKRIASAGADATVRFWDVTSGKQLQKLQVGTNPIVALAFSGDGTLLAAGEGEISGSSGNPGTTYFPYGSAGGVAIWNTTNYQLIRVFQGDTNGVVSLALSLDGRKLAFSGGRRQCHVQLHDVTETRPLATQTNFAGYALGLSFTPDGRELIVGDWFPWGDFGEIIALDALTLEQKRLLIPDAGRLLCVATSPDGKKIASAGVDRIARVWDSASGAELATFYGHGAPIVSLAFTPDGRGLATASWDNRVRVWNLETSPTRQRIETLQSFSVAFSPDGKLLASAGIGAELREVASGKLVRSLIEFTNRSDGHVAFSPDGARVAAAEIQGTLHVWDTRTWQHYLASKDPAIPPYRGYPYPGDMLAFSPDGASLVQGFGKSIPFWNAHDGKLAGIITNGTVPNSLAFTPDGKGLLVGSDRRISLLDLATKTPVASFPSSCRRLAISSDGRWAASAPASVPSTIVLREIPKLRVHARLAGHKDMIYSIAFSHDGRLLASGSWDGTVKIWHVATGNELLSILSLGGVVWTVAFAPDDRTLAFGSGSGRSKDRGAITLLRAATEREVSHVRKSARQPLPPHSELMASIPSRSKQCPANLIDLSEVYTAPFEGFSGLPPGIQTLGGVQFDLRGIVMLSGSHPDMIHDFPASARAIQVGRRCQALHFLHAASWGEEGGTTIGEYVIHFTDGRLVRSPLIYGENITDHFCPPDDPPVSSPAARLVWRGENATSRKYGGEIRFYDFRWQNPHPESQIKCIDFKSSLALSGPFLIAITAED